MTIQKKMTFPVRSFLFRLASALAIVFFFAMLARAGGPKYVAGFSYFNSGTMGQPITWSSGQVNYYTDQGDLSPILPNASANSLVANAFAQWTSVSAAALTATNGGQLAEDVNGGNIALNSSGIISAPADITPSATQTPVGIVYDYDGSVTDALLGAGAGDPSQCFWNAVYGGVDNFGASANFLHALVVINGQCALQSSQLTDIEYRLVRVLGSVIGLGWSQMNLNVITGKPHPTPADYAGFPVMHFMDPATCVPITVCYANPYQLAPDDVAALSRLYPADPSTATARIYGSVYFVDHTGQEAQPMQGANVIARWIDPSTKLGNDLTLTPGDPTVTQPGMPIILSASQSTAQSDFNGLASFIPSVGSFTGPLEIDIQVSAGTTAVLQNELETFPAGSGGNTSPPSSSFWHGSAPAPRGPPF